MCMCHRDAGGGGGAPDVATMPRALAQHCRLFLFFRLFVPGLGRLGGGGASCRPIRGVGWLRLLVLMQWRRFRSQFAACSGRISGVALCSSLAGTPFRNGRR